MREIKDTVARTSICGVQHGGNIKRLTFAPGFKSGRGENVVQHHRKFHAVFGGEERINRERAEFIERRRLGLQDQFVEFNILALASGILENISQQHMFTCAQRIDLFVTDQSQQRSHRA